MASIDKSPFELPRLRVHFTFENDTRFLDIEDETAEFYDVKFCPYQPLEQNPVFAAISKKHVLICSLSSDSGTQNPCTILTVIRDEDEDSCACCCTWVQAPNTGDPWLCVGGADGKIKVYDVVAQKLIECFTGHGGEVSDLATSPLNPLLIVSASEDKTIRAWSLDPADKDSPCRCIFAGAGHQEAVLSADFHQTGRYIVSGGHDQQINLWTMPDLPSGPMTSPKQVLYPHFSTTSIHYNIVDCVQFFGDLILSRACNDPNIVMWKITGFTSDGPPPSDLIAPIPTDVTKANYDDISRFTRSAFLPSKLPGVNAFTKLALFHTPGNSSQFFMRFGLHHVPDQNPVLAFCNAGGNVFMWDLERMTIYQRLADQMNDPNREDSQNLVVPSWLRAVKNRPNTTSRASESAADKEGRQSGQSGRGDHSKGKDSKSAISAESLEAWDQKYSLQRQPAGIPAHKKESSKEGLVGRKAAWSPGGEWCVVAGSGNYILVLQRWAKGKV